MRVLMLRLWGRLREDSELDIWEMGEDRRMIEGDLGWVINLLRRVHPEGLDYPLVVVVVEVRRHTIHLQFQDRSKREIGCLRLLHLMPCQSLYHPVFNKQIRWTRRECRKTHGHNIAIDKLNNYLHRLPPQGIDSTPITLARDQALQAGKRYLLQRSQRIRCCRSETQCLFRERLGAEEVEGIFIMLRVLLRQDHLH